MLEKVNHVSIRGKLADIVSDKFLRASAKMVLSGVGGGVLGYVFQVLMGRMLNVEDYGIYNTLMAIVAVLGVLLSTLSMVVTRRVSEYRVSNDLETAADMYWWVNQKLLWVMIVSLASILPFTPWVGSYFHLEKHTSIYLLFFMIFVMAFGPVNIAYLQALQKFNWLAVNALTSHGFKILFCTILIYAGFKLNGALIGAALAAFASWLMTYTPLRSIVGSPIGIKKCDKNINFSGVFPVLIANLSFVIMTQLDIILVNHYYNSYDSGVYAAAAILGKAVMYLPAAIAIAIFPMVAENEARKQGSAGLLVNAMTLTIALAGAASVFYLFFADNVIVNFYGEKYQGSAEILKHYGYAMMPMTIIMVAEHFLIAKGRVVFAYVMMLGIPFVLVAADIYHNSLMDMILILTVCGWMLLVVGFVVLGWQYWSDKEMKNEK